MATLLPNSKQVFVDANGVPLAGGTVTFYVPGTTTPKDTYQNALASILNANPVVLDAAGSAIIYGVGSYRQMVRDAIGNLIWDQITADTSTAGIWAGTSTGTPNAQAVTVPSFSNIDGQQITFIAGFTNTGSFALVPNGAAAIPAKKDTTDGPIVLVGGDIHAGNIYTATYDASAGIFHIVPSSQTVAAAQTSLNLQLVGRIPCTITGSGTDNVLTFTPLPNTPPITALVDGLRLRGTAPYTAILGSIPQVIVAGLAAPTKLLKAPDAYTYALFYDFQKNRPLEIEYDLIMDVWTIQSVPNSWKQAAFGNGQIKLQTSAPTTISLTQNDGQGILIWNTATASFRQVGPNTITNSALFGPNNYVGGVPNIALQPNTLYMVYVFGKTPTNDQDIALDFYPSSAGVGNPVWNPIVNEIGMYVKPKSQTDRSPDNTRTYVGQLWTGPSNVQPILSGPQITLPCQSHYCPWEFPLKCDLITASGMTSLATNLSSPSITLTSEGILEAPFFQADVNIQNNTAGSLNTVQLQVTGTTFDGNSFTAYSEVAKYTNSTASAWGRVHVSIGSATPQGVFTCRVIVGVGAGTATFEISLSAFGTE